jgi:DNA-binding CsgD family transcriptional regulator
LQGARRARQQAQSARQARNALDAFGYASITVRLRDGRVIWQTALARTLLDFYFDSEEINIGRGLMAPPSHTVPQNVLVWLRRHVPQMLLPHPLPEPPRLVIEHGARRLTLRLHQQAGDSEGGGDWLLVMREESDTTIIEAISQSFKLTGREAEVLYWVIKGKINRDIGDILGASPATVKKHLEHIYAKMGVETRTSAAGMAMGRIRQLHPQFEG